MVAVQGYGCISGVYISFEVLQHIAFRFQLLCQVFLLIKSNPMAAEFIYLWTSAECAGPINRPTTFKWLKQLIMQHIVVTSPSLSIFNSRLYNVKFEKFLIIQMFTFYICIITKYSIILILFHIVEHILTVMFYYFRHTFSAPLKVGMYDLAFLVISVFNCTF